MWGIPMVSRRCIWRVLPVVALQHSHASSLLVPNRATRQAHDRETQPDGSRFEYNARCVGYIREVSSGIDFWGSRNDRGRVRFMEILQADNFQPPICFSHPSLFKNASAHTGITAEERTMR